MKRWRERERKRVNERKQRERQREQITWGEIYNQINQIFSHYVLR